METRIVCKQCGTVIAEEEVVSAVRINQAILAICQACLSLVPQKMRVAPRLALNPNIITVFRANRNQAKKDGLEIIEARFSIPLRVFRQTLANVCLNKQEV